jgi:hypothetical protein
VHRARCAAHGLASYTLVSEDLLSLDVVALFAAEGQKVSIVGELPAVDEFVEAAIQRDHQRLTAGLATGQVVPVRRDVECVPRMLGCQPICESAARVRVVRKPG